MLMKKYTNSHVHGQITKYTFVSSQKHTAHATAESCSCRFQRQPSSDLPFVFFQEKQTQGKTKKIERKMSQGLDKNQRGREQ